MDKQTITGDGGASYTLTHAVANAQEIEVFVNNVRQEAGVAYTVNGNALSMTGNVASTDDFYVIYQGKALQTVVPPDGSVSTGKLANGAVTDAKITSVSTTKLTGSIGSSLLPTGSVIQTVFTTPYLNGVTNPATSYINTTSTSYVGTPATTGGYYIDITPTSTSSKILVSVAHPAYCSGSYGYFVIKRSTDGGSTYTDVSDYDTSLSYESHAVTGNSMWMVQTYFHLDSPATTSSVRYGIHFKTNSSSAALTIGWTNANTKHNSTMLSAMEIVG